MDKGIIISDLSSSNSNSNDRHKLHHIAMTLLGRLAWILSLTTNRLDSSPLERNQNRRWRVESLRKKTSSPLSLIRRRSRGIGWIGSFETASNNFKTFVHVSTSLVAPSLTSAQRERRFEQREKQRIAGVERERARERAIAEAEDRDRVSTRERLALWDDDEIAREGKELFYADRCVCSIVEFSNDR